MERYCCDGHCTQGRKCPRLDPEPDKPSHAWLVSAILVVLLASLALLTTGK